MVLLVLIITLIINYGLSSGVLSGLSFFLWLIGRLIVPKLEVHVVSFVIQCFVIVLSMCKILGYVCEGKKKKMRKRTIYTQMSFLRIQHTIFD